MRNGGSDKRSQEHELVNPCNKACSRLTKAVVVTPALAVHAPSSKLGNRAVYSTPWGARLCGPRPKACLLGTARRGLHARGCGRALCCWRSTGCRVPASALVQQCESTRRCALAKSCTILGNTFLVGKDNAKIERDHCRSASLKSTGATLQKRAKMFSLRFGGPFNWGLPRRPNQQRRQQRQPRASSAAGAPGGEAYSQRVSVSPMLYSRVAVCCCCTAAGRLGCTW